MTISFIIPVYNGERYISACLYSLLKQTYTDWQAILINDGVRTIHFLYFSLLRKVILGLLCIARIIKELLLHEIEE